MEQSCVGALARFETLGDDSDALDETGLYAVGAYSGENITLDNTMLVHIDDVAATKPWIVTREDCVLRAFIRRFPDSSYINDARMALADISLEH